MTLGRLLGLTGLVKKASLVGAFFVPAIWLSAAQAQVLCAAPRALTYAQVERVADGDSLRLKDGRSVRLIGLNAPETGKKGRPDEPFADAARKRLQALVTQSNGRVGLLLGQQPQDRYGRTLAHVFGANGSNFEAQLLADGLGFQVALAPNVELLDCQQAAEHRARAASMGVWRLSPVVSPQQISRSGFAVVSAKVTKVQRNRGGLWIDLEGGAVVRIAPDQLHNFDQNAFAHWLGKRIEVRGWVLDRAQRSGLKKDQARWMLSLSHPGMINVAQN